MDGGIGHEQTLAGRLPEQCATTAGAVAPRLSLFVAGFLAILAMVMTALLLPRAAVDWIAKRWSWIGLVLQWVDHAHLAINLLHVVLFVPLGVSMACALRRQGLSGAIGLLLGLGALTEALQSVIPGRHAKLSDVAVDLLAGLVGWCLVRSMSALRLRWDHYRFIRWSK